MLGYGMECECFGRLGRQGVLISGELGSDESRSWMPIALMWCAAEAVASAADHRLAQRRCQSVAEQGEKWKKWCVLVHFGASLVQRVSAVHSMWWYAQSLSNASGRPS